VLHDDRDPGDHEQAVESCAEHWTATRAASLTWVNGRLGA